MSVVVNSPKRTHLTLATLESQRELLPFYSSVAFVALIVAFVALIVAFVPLVAFGPLVAPCAHDHLSEFEEAL